MNFKKISNNINTQDNRITADPLFCVFEKEYIWGMDPDYCDDYQWHDDDYNEVTVKNLKNDYDLTEEQAEYDDHGYNLYKVHYIVKDRFVNAHFTEVAAKEHIRINGHNLKKPFIYVTSLFRCEEMKQIRNFLKSKFIFKFRIPFTKINILITSTRR